MLPGIGMEFFVARSKVDHSGLGRRYKTPALERLCLVAAYLDWIHIEQLNTGPVFRTINRWGGPTSGQCHQYSQTMLRES